MSFLFVISAKYQQIPTEARTESFVDNTNNLEVSFEVPNYWNSGTLFATIPKLDWKVHNLVTATDDATTFFAVTSLPYLTNLMLPLGQGSGILSEFLKHYATLKSEFDVTFNDGTQSTLTY